MSLLEFSDRGIHCPQADVYIDPWRAVDRAVITHAHSDHARRGHRHYLCSPVTEPLLRTRLDRYASISTLAPGRSVTVNGVRFSLHPAGHIPGSMQVRVEHQGEVWVATGDHKRDPDGVSEPFEPVRCHTFITECTFGLPIYRWPDPTEVFAEIDAWWRQNASEGVCSILSAYSLGKAQRVLMGVDRGIGPIYVHGAVANMNEALAQAGLQLPEVKQVTPDTPKEELKKALVITPGSAIGTPWTRRMRPFSTAMVSGWMQLRGWRRRGNLDRGFVLSDHADWDDLLQAVKDTGAERIIATHGYTDHFSRFLRECGYDATSESTEFAGESEEGSSGTSTRSVDPPGRPEGGSGRPEQTPQA